jgi:uncharacterized metal-binding protein YceD (DUF177 family)
VAISFSGRAPQWGGRSGPAADNRTGAVGRVAVSEIMPEFSRIVPLVQLGSARFRQQIEATPSEREKLSRRLDLLALERLIAVVELRRQGDEVIVLEAAYQAEFVQSCVVTLEPVDGVISDRFVLVYGPAEEQPKEFVEGRDEPAFEPLTGDAIDIGEAVAQELSLALPVFPRLADASIDAEIPEQPVASPFAALARLRRTADR